MNRERLIGGNPLGVALRLVVMSIVVGIVLSALDLRPENLLGHVRLLLERIYRLGFGALDGILGYFLIGAVVVIPIWILVRVISALRHRSG